MSALGQKQTHAVQQRMSALPPIATAKADIRKRSCLLSPESGHVRCTSECPLWAKSRLMQRKRRVRSTPKAVLEIWNLNLGKHARRNS